MKLRQNTFLSMAGLLLLVIVLTGTLTGIFFSRENQKQIQQETFRQGLNISPELNRLLLWNDQMELARNLDQNVQANSSLILGFIERQGKLVVAGEDKIPNGLLGLQDSPLQEPKIIPFGTEDHQLLQDYVFPLDDQGHLLHLVLDPKLMYANIRGFMLTLAGTCLVGIIFGIMLAYFTSRRVTSTTEVLHDKLLAKNRDLVTLNHQLSQQQGQLIMSEKMASLGQLSAGIAHEINNPIGFITSNLHTMQDYVASFHLFTQACKPVLDQPPVAATSPAEPIQLALADAKKIWATESLEFVMEDMVSLLDDSQEGLHRVTEIVKNLKTFARQDLQSPEPTDLGKCLESTLKIVAGELNKKCVVTQRSEPVPLVSGYPGKIKQVLTNLLVNAAQAIETEGEIQITTTREGDNVVLRIADTGCGISEKDLALIFDPFFTTKPVGEGTGLGLSISHSIVAEHGGTLEAVSEIGQGTTFTMTLPIAEKDTGSPPEVTQGSNLIPTLQTVF